MLNVGHVWEAHLRALRPAAAFLAAGLRAAGLAAFLAGLRAALAAGLRAALAAGLRAALAAGLRAALAAGLRADLAGAALFAIEQKKNRWVIVH